MAIPDSMRAVQLRAYHGKPESIAVVEMPVPRPGPGEVLIRVFASPINPSDLMFIRGLNGGPKDCAPQRCAMIMTWETRSSFSKESEASTFQRHDRAGSTYPCRKAATFT